MNRANSSLTKKEDNLNTNLMQDLRSESQSNRGNSDDEFSQVTIETQLSIGNLQSQSLRWETSCPVIELKSKIRESFSLN